MKRRTFLGALALGTTALAGMKLWPDEGVFNPCLQNMPETLRRHAVVSQAWQEVDPQDYWDSHVHLLGKGDSGSAMWVNPKLSSLWHPLKRVQSHFYENAACAQAERSDVSVVERLLQLHADFPPGVRLMLLAFDWFHDARGQAHIERSTFYVPNHYAWSIARAHPQAFTWVASIHPYRGDAIETLHWAVENGARAVKWLPAAMGIDPAAAQCDRFYNALARLNIPLITHAGTEHAVDAAAFQALGNPLRLRRALDLGARVIVAHCASTGKMQDLDQGPQGPWVPAVSLFARLMDEPRYGASLYGDLSAVTQINREDETLQLLWQRADWHPRLLNGSDYPLPGIMPLFSLRRFVTLGWLDANTASTLSAIRRYNPLLFDFVLKRSLKIAGQRLQTTVFSTRRHFVSAGHVN